jgi:hypothetical protein
MPDKGRVLTGARARFLINGKKVGYATNVTVTETIENQPVEALDNIEVEEFVPIAYRVALTAAKIRIVRETFKSEGYFPKTGASPQEHLTNILNQADMTCTLEDSKSPGTLLMTVQQVKIAERNMRVDARGLVGEDVTFNAVRMLDESEVSQPAA